LKPIFGHTFHNPDRATDSDQTDQDEEANRRRVEGLIEAGTKTDRSLGVASRPEPSTTALESKETVSNTPDAPAFRSVSTLDPSPEAGPTGDEYLH